MKARLFWLIPLLALPLAAQTDSGTYQGPGVLGAGAGDIGTRSGQPVDLRVYGGLNAVYDTNVQPLATDAQGNLVHTANLYGVEASFGAYGEHNWQRTELGLSYSGDYRFYPNNSTYDGTDQSLLLGITAQYSSRVLFDLRLMGATLGRSTGAVADAAVTNGSLPGTQLFDTRASYVDVSGSMTLIQSPRTSYSFGGGANGYYYQSGDLTTTSGFHANASFNERLSASNSMGATYSYARQSATNYLAQTHSFALQYLGKLGHFWTLTVAAGATLTQIHQAIALQLNPDLAFLFGAPSIVLPFDTTNVYPSGKADLKRDFQRGTLRAYFERSVGAGNGFFLTAVNESTGVMASYSGIQKWNFGIDGSYRTYGNLGQGSSKETWYGGGAGVTYQIARYTHLSARIDIAHYDLGQQSVYRRTAERATLGVYFSPGNIPLSLW